jgi:hypothetical protein
MTIEERITAEVHRLPPDRQREVLDFVEFLARQSARPRPRMKSAEEATSLETTAAAHGWPPGFFSEVIGGWAGEALTRESEGDYEQRDALE